MSRNERWRRFRKSNRTWDSPWLPAIAAVLAGVFGALVVGDLQSVARGLGPFGRTSSWAPLWGFLLGFIALGVPILLIQHGIRRVVREVRALVNIRPFTGPRLLAHDPWAMDAIFAEQMLSLVDEAPEQVVELGSGHSTVLMAERLEALGRGHITALDHDAAYADRTRAWLRDAGLDHRATVVHAPIGERRADGRTVRWYAGDDLDAALPERIDLLVVDGPPDKLGRDARWPAVPLLRDRLAPGAVVLMDDGDRPDERRAAFDWHGRLGGRIRYVPGGKGGWILRTPE